MRQYRPKPATRDFFCELAGARCLFEYFLNLKIPVTGYAIPEFPNRRFSVKLLMENSGIA
jgi:hypothetical protein